MPHDEIERIATSAATKALQQFIDTHPDKCGMCVSPEFAERHMKHHEFVDELLEFMGRVNEIKWSTARAITKIVAVALLAGFAAYYFGVKLP